MNDKAKRNGTLIVIRMEPLFTGLARQGRYVRMMNL